jgi:hypothetical protein
MPADLWCQARIEQVEATIGIFFLLVGLTSSSLLRRILIGSGEGFPDHACLASFAGEILVVDPAVGFLESVAE